MRDASLQDITKFLGCKRIAFVGVSRNSLHFSRALFREFLAQGYDAVPVNPEATEIEGRACFAAIANISPQAEAAILMTGSPEMTNQVLRECDQAAVPGIWIYKNFPEEQNHQTLVENCRLRGLSVIEGHCPFMFLPRTGMVHRVHRLLLKITGNYPV